MLFVWVSLLGFVSHTNPLGDSHSCPEPLTTKWNLALRLTRLTRVVLGTLSPIGLGIKNVRTSTLFNEFLYCSVFFFYGNLKGGVIFSNENLLGTNVLGLRGPGRYLKTPLFMGFSCKLCRNEFSDSRVCWERGTVPVWSTSRHIRFYLLKDFQVYLSRTQFIRTPRGGYINTTEKEREEHLER